MSDLTYRDIERLIELLSKDDLSQADRDRDILRLLLQVLIQNRYLADQIGSSEMRSRLAFGNTNEVLDKMDKFIKEYQKLKDDIDFMLGMVTGIKRGKQQTKRKIKGIPIGKRSAK
jgi:hypothetical protein